MAKLSTQSSDQAMSHSGVDHGFIYSRVCLIVLDRPPVYHKPGERPRRGGSCNRVPFDHLSGGDAPDGEALSTGR